MIETINFIKSKTDVQPKVGIVLGSGLGDIANKIFTKDIIAYKDIPNFIAPTIEGHKGNLIFGYIDNIPVVLMQGRNHYYEGYTMKQITYPIKVMKELGVDTLITSNATGGLNPSFRVGDIMLVNDHINLMGDNPLKGPNDSSGPRFLDVTNAYDSELRNLAKMFCMNNDIRCSEGVLVAISGPNYESPAEYKFMKIIGGDAVGMSTIPEVLVARHCGMKVFSMSLITNLNTIENKIEINHDDVQTIANQSAQKMGSLILHLVSNIK
jgi:purine-nucleoside phosphorylase